MVLVIAIGCGASGAPDGSGGGGGGSGGGGSGDSAECTDLRAQFDTLVKANTSCSVDADCMWFADACFDLPGCDTFVNRSVATQLADLETQGKKACAPCGDCLALEAACNNGTCGLKGH